jgi:tetratricopeptide (TPR) repeat protein
MKLGKQSRRWMMGTAAAFLLMGAGSASAAPAQKKAPVVQAGKAAVRAQGTSAFERAHTLLQKGDKPGALREFERALAADGSNVGLWQVVGDLRFSLDKVRPAVDAWAQAAALAPWNDGLVERVARGSVRLGDFARAAEAEARVVALLARQLEEGGAQRRDIGTGRSISIAESYVQHLGMLAELHVLAGDFTSAEQAARTLIRFAPTRTEGRLALAYVHLHGAEYDEAAELYEEIIRVEPENGPALNNLGNIQYMRRDFNAAAELFERILESDGASKYSQSIATANLGELLQLQSAFKDARAMYDQAIELQPEGAWGYMGKAALLDVTGQYDAAVDQMIDGWERDQNQLTRLNMHFYMDEWAWQRDALIAEIEGDTALAEKLWRQVLDGDVEMLKKSAAWHLRSLQVATR